MHNETMYILFVDGKLPVTETTHFFDCLSTIIYYLLQPTHLLQNDQAACTPPEHLHQSKGHHTLHPRYYCSISPLFHQGSYFLLPVSGPHCCRWSVYLKCVYVTCAKIFLVIACVFRGLSTQSKAHCSKCKQGSSDFRGLMLQ